MRTNVFSVGKRAGSSRGLAQSCSLSLLSALSSGTACVIYVHFFLLTEALKSATLKKKKKEFLCKRLL